MIEPQPQVITEEQRQFRANNKIFSWNDLVGTKHDVGRMSELQHPSEPPIQEVVLKVHEGCNLACDYCYMYNLADQSYVTRPNEMSDEVVLATADSMGKYARLQNIPHYLVVLHGGEPLLRTPDFFDRTATTFREVLGSYAIFRGLATDGSPIESPVSVDFGVQTNATRITDEHLEVFAKHNVQIGVSLDGNGEANDRHRVYRRGIGSYDKVVAGIHRIIDNPRFRHLFGSILCVVDPRNDPITTYQTLRSFGPKAIDWQLPLGNWVYRPPFREDNTLDDLNAPVPTPYADWLIPIFDLWCQDMITNPKTTPKIPYFTTIINSLGNLAGGRETTGGLKQVGALFVETDGSLHLVDSLKSTKEGLTDLEINIHSGTPLVEVHMKASNTLRRLGALSVPLGCLDCEIRQTCGGGYHPNRYTEKNGEPKLDAPSVYHPDLFKLITHIRDRLLRKKPRAPRVVHWTTLDGQQWTTIE